MGFLIDVHAVVNKPTVLKLWRMSKQCPNTGAWSWQSHDGPGATPRQSAEPVCWDKVVLVGGKYNRRTS